MRASLPYPSLTGHGDHNQDREPAQELLRQAEQALRREGVWGALDFRAWHACFRLPVVQILALRISPIRPLGRRYAHCQTPSCHDVAASSAAATMMERQEEQSASGGACGTLISVFADASRRAAAVFLFASSSRRAFLHCVAVAVAVTASKWRAKRRPGRIEHLGR